MNQLGIAKVSMVMNLRGLLTAVISGITQEDKVSFGNVK